MSPTPNPAADPDAKRPTSSPPNAIGEEDLSSDNFREASDDSINPAPAGRCYRNQARPAPQPALFALRSARPDPLVVAAEGSSCVARSRLPHPR